MLYIGFMKSIFRGKFMSKMLDLISVIVPVFNVEQYLNRCVESIVGQSYQNLEIILVEDGSPDMCSQICDDWAKKDKRIKVIHKGNGGLSDARNAGMEIASGDFIGFVDSDDWIAPEMYEKLIDAIKREECDIAACSVEMVWEDGRPRCFLTEQINCTLSTMEAQAALLDETKLKQPVWYKLYRRKVVEGVPFEKGKYHEDVFWSYQVIGNASKVSVIDYIGYYYWQRKESIMGETYSLKRLDAMEAYCRRYVYMREKFPKLEVAARRAVLANCIYHGQMVMLHLPKTEQRKVFEYLEQIKQNHSVKWRECKDMKMSHRIWLIMGQKSLKTACCFKNLLKIGL